LLPNNVSFILIFFNKDHVGSSLLGITTMDSNIDENR
jgi:hypothetical protein